MKTSNLMINSSSGINNHQVFKELATHVCDLLTRENIELIPFSSANVHWFSSLPDKYKSLVLMKLQSTLNIYKTTLAAGHSLRDCKRLLWSALKEFQLSGPSDLLDKLDSKNVIVEIYDNSQIQIFCNLRFYDFCSYTLEDLFCRPFQELFRRDNPEATKRILEVGLGLFQGTINEAADMSTIGTQIVCEIDSPLKYEYEMKIRSFTPLHKKGSRLPEALVALESARFLNHEEVERTKSQRLNDWENRQLTL